jgi:hypothetical protein
MLIRDFIVNKNVNMDRREVASLTNSLQKNFATRVHDGPYAIITGQLLFLFFLTLATATKKELVFVFVADFINNQELNII